MALVPIAVFQSFAESPALELINNAFLMSAEVPNFRSSGCVDFERPYGVRGDGRSRSFYFLKEEFFLRTIAFTGNAQVILGPKMNFK